MKLAGIAALGTVAAALLIAGSTGNVNGNSFGDPKAPITIEVFSDFQCPGCKAFHDNTFPKIMGDYVVSGKVYVIYRFFPLQGHVYGRTCAEYACAASRVGRYAKVADALFAQQAAITANGKVEDVVNSVLTPSEAKTVGGLLKSPDVKRQIETDMAEGNAVPIRSTPTLVVTYAGKSQPVDGLMAYSLFKQYLDSLLAK